MLTRANKPVSSRPTYPTEKEALAMHTEPFSDFIKEMLVNTQSTPRSPRLVRLVGGENLPCTITDAIKAVYPDMLPEVIARFRMAGLAEVLTTPGMTMDKFRDKLMIKLAEVNGCWPAILETGKLNARFEWHQIRVALWVGIYDHNFELTGDHQAAYKFAELYKDEIDRFCYDFKARASNHGKNDTASISRETFEYVKSEILTHGTCKTYSVEIHRGPTVVLS